MNTEGVSSAESDAQNKPLDPALSYAKLDFDARKLYDSLFIKG